MYYNRLYHPSRNINHLFRKSVKRYSARFTPFLSARERAINVIGYNVDEATFAIDKFLDDCALAKIETARIVHGKGTGALRNGIHTFLRKHPHVASFRLGTFGEGEMGVTVVEIK